MARNTDSFNQVSQVFADTTREEAIKSVADIGGKLLERSQEAKITQNMARAQIKLADLDNQFQIQNQGNPTADRKEYNEQRQSILNEFGGEISPMYRGMWDDNARRLAEKSDATMKGWELKQLHTNSVEFINDSMELNYRQSATDGQNFASGKMSDVEAFANFHTSRETLMKYGAANLGEIETKKLLDGYDKDYMKSFIAGTAETNPAKAAGLLETETVQEVLTPDEKSEMINVINTTKRRQEIQKSFTQTSGGSDVTNIVNDESKTYFEKRLEIDKMEFQGLLTTKAAAKARRVITSQKNVDSVTSTPVMADIVNRMYDLNAIADSSSEDYLTGVQNIQEEILGLQASGKIRTQDVQTLNNRLTTLTAAKVSGATQSVGNNFYEANKKFETLPPEYRGRATRELFYATEGMEDPSETQLNGITTKIVDKMNQERRAATVKLTQEITQSDTDFLTTTVNPATKTPYTMDDVKETAAKYGMTEADVIAKMRAKRMQK